MRYSGGFSNQMMPPVEILMAGKKERELAERGIAASGFQGRGAAAERLAVPARIVAPERVEWQPPRTAMHRPTIASSQRWSSGCDANYARRLPPAMVDDAIQDTLIAVHEKRHTYDPHRPFGAWLRRSRAISGSTRCAR